MLTIMNAPTHISANIVSQIYYVCMIEFDTHNSFLHGYIILWRMYEIIFLLFNTDQMFIWISDVWILDFLNNVRFFFINLNDSWQNTENHCTGNRYARTET